MMSLLMAHSLTFIPDHLRKPLFWAALLLTLGLFAAFRVLNAPITTPAAPGGIVTFELAGTVKKAVEIFNSWDTQAGLYAAFGLGLDYLFMPAYALARPSASCWRRGVTPARGRKPARGWDGARWTRPCSTRSRTSPCSNS